jgi:uncharacterized membrane protein
MSPRHRPEQLHILHPRGAALRLIGASILGVLAAAVSGRGHDWIYRSLLGWDTGAFALLSVVWFFLWTRDSHETRCRAAAADPGRAATSILVLIASAFSLFAGAFVLRHLRQARDAHEALLLPFCLFAVIAAWLLTHTSYTLRYAHLYYREDDEGEGGLEFPGTQKPSDFDFAYFAFTIGMCFQVSDVAISSPQIRQTVLWHAVISFAYNTVILALALNLFFGYVAPT